MSEIKIETIELVGDTLFAFPSIKSVKLKNVEMKGEWVEGDIEINYEFDGNQSALQHFKTKLNEEFVIKVSYFDAKVHVWLDGPELWFGVAICLGSLCTPELKTGYPLKV